MIRTDSHAHLSYLAERRGEAFLAGILSDYDAAEAAGSSAFLLDPGVGADDYRARRRLLGRLRPGGGRAGAGSPPWLRAAAGLWPGREALEDPKRALRGLREELALAAAEGLPGPDAIGECGFDLHHRLGSPESQAALLGGQLDLAEGLGLPLIVHSRDAAGETLGFLEARRPSVPVLIHCFGYGPRECEAFLRLGCLLSFAGNISYRGAEALREALVMVPAESLLLETDAPYLNPEPSRREPSTPRDVERTYALAAELRGEDEEALATSVARAFLRAFPPARA